MTFIETPRLRLRQWKEADLDTFIGINLDPEGMRYFPELCNEERTIELYRIIQQEFLEYGYGLYAVEEKSSNDFMGFIGFHHAGLAVDFCPCIEIGWRLSKAYWNKGYATEGAKACLAYGFGKLGFDKVYSFTAIENKPSQNVMQKIGMTIHCYFEHPEIEANHILRPHVCYSIDQNQFFIET